jgi:hypothetical protein
VGWAASARARLEVGGRAGERLHVDAPELGVEPERLERALLAQALRHVDELVAAVVARAGIALAVLVRHDRADGLHHGRGDEVLGGDELEALHTCARVRAGAGRGAWRRAGRCSCGRDERVAGRSHREQRVWPDTFNSM